MELNRRRFLQLAGLTAAAAATRLPAQAQAAKPAAAARYKRIGVEEHFSTPEQIDLLRAILEKRYDPPEVVEQEKFILSDAPFLAAPASAPPLRQMFGQLFDVGAGRVAVMDKYGIDLQVVSLVSPGVQAFDAAATRLARKFNDHLARLIAEHPQRFAGLTALAPQAPEAAADELERGVRELKFKGGIINSHTKGEYLDEPKYRPILERAQKLEVPLYLHPRGPSPRMMPAFAGHPLLGGATWGFGADTGLHAMRLISGGVFDRYPRLRIVLGHLGETIPFQLDRIDNRWAVMSRSAGVRTLAKMPSEYFKQNFVVTTSGMFSHPQLALTLAVLGADKVLFAVDYPMEEPQEAVTFLDTAPISAADREQIYHGNAERVFALA
jgi:2,3-dihydroxybenzoate decarboxylase